MQTESESGSPLQVKQSFTQRVYGRLSWSCVALEDREDEASGAEPPAGGQR